MSKPLTWLFAVSAAVAAVALAILAGVAWRHHASLGFGTEYHAVLFNNGQAFFGRLSNASADYPVLDNVFYIQSRVNPETKQTTNVLVRRGKEWHGPDRMMINRQSVMFIEPVKPDSEVAKLIAQQNRQP